MGRIFAFFFFDTRVCEPQVDNSSFKKFIRRGIQLRERQRQGKTLETAPFWIRAGIPDESPLCARAHRESISLRQWDAPF